ncbi:MAG: hypothetical protein E7256_13220 [Lachnospiraceae bacterium]|nr:hypothetical protein [Lachnospiraceae bacterium]
MRHHNAFQKAKRIVMRIHGSGAEVRTKVRIKVRTRAKTRVKIKAKSKAEVEVAYRDKGGSNVQGEIQ